MNSLVIPNGLAIALLILAGVFFVDAFRRASWSSMQVSDGMIIAALTSFVYLGHRMSFTLVDGSQLHYLGAAFLAVTLGYCRGLMSMAVILFFLHDWQRLGIELIVNAVLPLWLMQVLIQTCKKRLPPNPFVFTLGCGFFGLFAIYAIQLMAGASIHRLFASVAGGVSWGELLTYKLILAAGESTLEGMILVVLVVYMPRAVSQFDDDFYLSR